MGDLVEVRLRGALASKRSSPEQESERKAALQDLRFAACFRPATESATGETAGPFLLEITAEREYLRLSLIPHSASASGAGEEAPPAKVHARLALMSIKRVLRDYGILCANHFEALQAATAQQIESLDMARRALHNEAAVMLVELLAPKIRLDEAAARKLFTLLFVLISAPTPGIALLYAVRPSRAQGLAQDENLPTVDSGANFATGADTNTDTDTGTNTDTNTGTDTGTDSDKDRNRDRDTNTDTGTNTDTDSGLEKPLVPQGQAMESPSRVVVFICNSNAIRSPIAAALAQEILPADVRVLSAAAGDARDEPDGFVIRVMSERGHDVTNWKPLGLDVLLPTIEAHATGGTAMTIIALSNAAEPTVTDLARRLRVQAQKWRIADPSLVEFGQQARLEATREIATTIGEKIKNLLAPSLVGALVADDVVTARANSVSDKNALHSGVAGGVAGTVATAGREGADDDSAPSEAP